MYPELGFSDARLVSTADGALRVDWFLNAELPDPVAAEEKRIWWVIIGERTDDWWQIVASYDHELRASVIDSPKVTKDFPVWLEIKSDGKRLSIVVPPRWAERLPRTFTWYAVSEIGSARFIAKTSPVRHPQDSAPEGTRS